MGFTTGLLSGLALTLGTSYLTMLAHKSIRRTQSTSLQQQTSVLNALVDPQFSPYDETSSHRYAYKRYRNLPTTPPSRLDPIEEAYPVTDVDLRLLEEERRKSLVEMSKEGWNREIGGFIRDVQTTDWREVRERIERGAVVTWGRVRVTIAKAGEQGKEVAQEAREGMEEQKRALEFKQAGR